MNMKTNYSEASNGFSQYVKSVKFLRQCAVMMFEF